jgi:Flp pilus assembly protein TadG
VRVSRRTPRGEEGVTLAVVAISLFMLLAVVMLVVDVGGMLTLRRRMVNAADAAALAAAQSCARMNAAEAPLKADELATSNQSDAVRDAYFQEGCGTESAGEVTVRYHSIKDFYFAPIFGHEFGEVPASATAIWGPAGGATPVPIEFSVTPIGEVPCAHQEKGTECAYWHDNSTDFDIGDSSSWGFMSLTDWGVAPDAACPNSGSSDRASWIDGSSRMSVAVTSDPTYVCIDSGHSSSGWLGALQSQVGKIKYFPVNDPARMIRISGKEKYAIIGFIPLRVDAVLKGNDPEAVGRPGTVGRCTGTHTFTPNENFNLDSMGCYTSVDQISNLDLWKKVGNKRVTYQQGADYTFDSDQHVITWLTAPVPDVNVEFDWATVGISGKCGFRKPDPNAVCLVTSWQGAQVGGSLPGTGPDLGLRAVQLTK